MPTPAPEVPLTDTIAAAVAPVNDTTTLEVIPVGAAYVTVLASGVRMPVTLVSNVSPIAAQTVAPLAVVSNAPIALTLIPLAPIRPPKQDRH